MMSRLNWMTYLKVLFDKLASCVSRSMSQSLIEQEQAVDVYQLMEALT